MPYDRLLRHRTQRRTGTFTVTWCVHQRKRLLARPELAEAVVRAMHHRSAGESCCSHAFVVMPDHVHWLLSLTGERRLFDIVRATKAIASRTIRRIAPHLEGEVWQRGSYEHELRHDREIKAQARYIVANPLRAKLVARITEYPWWFAEWAPAPFGLAPEMPRSQVLID